MIALIMHSLQVLSGHSHKVSCIDGDERFVLSGSHDCLVKVWSTMDGSHIRDLIGHESQVLILLLT